MSILEGACGGGQAETEEIIIYTAKETKRSKSICLLPKQHYPIFSRRFYVSSLVI
jgi:hypothetical protein